MLKMGGWCWYLSGQEDKIEKHKCGKWMCFFDNQEFAQKICQEALETGVCYECKCTDMEVQMTDTGVICFYLNGGDIENHYRVIDFMIQHDLIRMTKSGRYYNNSFKFDNQTRAGEYSTDFEGMIKLNEFINLETGEHIRKDYEDNDLKNFK